MEQATAKEVVLRALNEVFTQTGLPAPDELSDDSVLVGTDAVIDSLGVVSLIVEIEQIVETEHGVSVILANEKAMSAKNSPFRTIGVLAEHLVATVAEVQAA